jgi:hypothetical protein
VRDALEVSGCARYGKFFQGRHLSSGIRNPAGRFKS